MTAQQLTLSWGTTPIRLTQGGTPDAMSKEAIDAAKANGLVRPGQQVAILNGDGVGAKVTNNLRIITVS